MIVYSLIGTRGLAGRPVHQYTQHVRVATLSQVEGKRAPNLLLRQARQARRETQEQTAQAVGALLGNPVDPEYIGHLNVVLSVGRMPGTGQRFGRTSA